MRRLLCATLLAALVSGVARGQSSNADGVSLRAGISADTVYVGQQVTYTLSVRIPSAVRQRLRRNPEFVPPEPRAMLAYDLPLAREGEPGDAYEVHTFRRALFVLTPGRYALGPARLAYAVPQSASFFSREDDRTLRAEGVGFVAVEPPLAGRPREWAGAVGQWRASLRAEPTATRVGDPFVLVLRLEGIGNATLLPRPPLTLDWADVVAQDERVSLDSTPALFRGAKEFSWLVTPRVAGTQAVPAVSYASFNPSARAYEMLRTEALTVAIRPGSVVDLPPRGPAPTTAAPLPLRESLEGPATVALPGRVPLTWLALLSPLPWLVLRLRPRRLRRRDAARPATDGSARAMLDAGLHQRTGLDIAELTDPGALAAALRVEGVTPETALEVEALRDACDVAAFAPSGGTRRAATPTDDLRARAAAVLAKVHAEARRRSASVLLLVALILAGCAGDGPDRDAVQAFAEGRTAYAGGDYVRAQEAFQRATLAAPRDPAAWANLGTAAWQAGDTATAVIGWQRALRLDPLAGDLRDRLARVTAPSYTRVAQVWPLPPLPLAVLGSLCWILGWGFLAVEQRRHGRGVRWPWGFIAPGVLLLALAAWQDARLAARDLVVVTEAAPLRALPALGADPGAVPMVGEVARIRETRGVWRRLELEGGRSGWYPAERLASLARD